MNKEEAKKRIRDTFESEYDESRFRYFIKGIFYDIEERNDQYRGDYIQEAYKDCVKSYKYLFKYTTKDQYKTEIAVLAVNVHDKHKLEKARSTQRNFIASFMNKRNKEAVLVAFYTDENDKSDWRFSFVKQDKSYNFETRKLEKMITPAKRYSYLVGETEKSHTAQSQLMPLLEKERNNPTLEELENTFEVEKVSKVFFEEYKGLYLKLVDVMGKIIEGDKRIKDNFTINNISTELFCKKLLGQIVFLYFIQKKGWLGVEKDKSWGSGDRKFLRSLFEKAKEKGENYFNKYLEPLFYEALATERVSHYYDNFDCKIPFLNGGLFDPVNNYDWKNSSIKIPNNLFSNDNNDGILDTFDIYNFTVKEDEPLEKEVAIDPEMLGLVFENLLDVRDRKSKGAFYTPREIVHYMCQESLIHYLHSKLNKTIDFDNLSDFIRYGDTFSEIEDKVGEIKSYKSSLPPSIKENAKEIDEALANVKICDPAIGSGAFLVGLMHEIIRARFTLLNSGFIKDGKKWTTYQYKRHIIQNSLYGVDIEESAIEIAKLRLWLSLVVDEDDIDNIKPLPNLDYKIVCGNSLLEIEKHLFNEEQLKKVEELKTKYFNTSSRNEKLTLDKQIKELLNSIMNQESIFDFKVYFSEIFKTKAGGFDIVIGNPPYVGEKGHKTIFVPIKQQSGKNQIGRFYQGKMDLFYFFFHLALDLLKSNGINAFITTNYYITATGGTNLRKDFKERATLLRLINFNELRIFESALGQHNMITLLQKKSVFSDQPKCKCCICLKRGFVSDKELDNIVRWQDTNSTYVDVSQIDLYDGKENYIRLPQENSDININTILGKISTASVLLGDICKVNQGIVSGADKVSEKHLRDFKIDACKNDGIFVLTESNPNDKLVLDKIRSAGLSNLIVPFYKNSDVHRYATKTITDSYILYVKKNEVDLDSVPVVKQHLYKFKDILDTSSDNSPFLHRPRNVSIFKDLFN